MFDFIERPWWSDFERRNTSNWSTCIIWRTLIRIWLTSFEKPNISFGKPRLSFETQITPFGEPNISVGKPILSFKTQITPSGKPNISLGVHSYTCFNDAVESYLRTINHPVPSTDMSIDDLKLLLLKAGKQDMIADKTAKIIAQFR